MRINLDKHFVLCAIIHKAKHKDKNKDRETEEINEDLPSQKQMYKMILELALKYNKLEEKVELMSKWVDKKKKKINILDWLNTSSNLKPELIFDNLADSMSILESDLNLLFNSNVDLIKDDTFCIHWYNGDTHSRNYCSTFDVNNIKKDDCIFNKLLIDLLSN